MYVRKQTTLIADVKAEFERRGWQEIEVKVMSDRFAVVTAQSHPGEVYLNTHLSIYIGTRSILGGHRMSFGGDAKIKPGRIGWSSTIAAYGPSSHFDR